MNVAPHLQKPLSIDTNICYDLDMTKFPGLGNPHYMCEPALVIESLEARQSWLSALKDDNDRNGDILEIGSDDLFTLIESCTPEVFTHTPNSDEDLDAFQDFLDDVIDKTSTVKVHDRISSSMIPSDSSRHHENYPYGCLEAPEATESSLYDFTITCYHGNTRDIDCQKRKRDSECDTAESRKESKLSGTWSYWNYMTDYCNASRDSTQQPCKLNREC